MYYRMQQDIISRYSWREKKAETTKSGDLRKYQAVFDIPKTFLYFIR